MHIVVYCGTNNGKNGNYRKAALALGTWIAQQNHQLVYGGGKSGLMGTLADTVLENGGQVVGIIPTFLRDREIDHPNLTELRVVETMSERKQMMLQLSDVCIALPGGPGTLEEISEAISWARIGQNTNPCIFFDVDHYYRPLQTFFDQMVSENFLNSEDRQNILFTDSIATLQNYLERF